MVNYIGRVFVVFLLFFVCSGKSLGVVDVTATVTADNHYALFYGNEEHLVYVGRNEKGYWGSGGYNWSLPETFSGLVLDDMDRFYVVQWDENNWGGGGTQALLAEFDFGNGVVLYTNSSQWLYYQLPIYNQGSNGDPPSTEELQAALLAAYWSTPGFSLSNGLGIWASYTGGATPGIGLEAEWISRLTQNDTTLYLTVFRSVPMSYVATGDVELPDIPPPSAPAVAAPEPSIVALLIAAFIANLLARQVWLVAD